MSLTEITEQSLAAEPVLVFSVQTRSDILGPYVNDIRITSCGTEAVSFTDGTMVGRRTPRDVFRLYDAFLCSDDWTAWTYLADALTDLLGTPRTQIWPCPTCEVPLPGAFTACSDPDCREADSVYTKRYERMCES